MIKKDEIIEIGKFQKTHALKGELNAILDINPDYLEAGNPLIIKNDGILVPYFVETIREKGKTSYLIKLEGIDNEAEAKDFVNQIIYADKKEVKNYISEEDEDLLTEDELIGYKVTDQDDNNIGKIEYIDDSTSNLLFVVTDDSGDRIYIPAHEEFIIEIDDSSKKIKMALPEGLLDLNSKKEKSENKEK